MKKWFTAFMALLLGLIAVVAAGCGTPRGKLYTLQEAYDNGWLTKDDIMSIAYYHNGGRERNEDIMAEDYAPQPKSPETIDKATEQAIKNAAAKYFKETENIENAEASGFSVWKYYGVYHGCYAVIMHQQYYNVPAVAIETWEEVGSVDFHYNSYFSWARIKIWKEV